ncbi:MAG: N-acetylneuraminate synthase family protein [Desulfobacterota bacterium]|nr:N-acetylneuraminate synthase family protein [Thermodesulfobacteriota bacterium]
MKIDRCDLDKEVMVVAEIGNNHEGSFARAEEMICRAADAGADAVKFQTIIPERLVSSEQHERIAQLRRFSLSYRQFEALKAKADKERVLFLSTPFDLESVRFLNELVPAFKIASGDIDFFPLLETVAQTGKPVILSTGCSTLAEVREAHARITQVWRSMGIDQEIALLHSVAGYPTPLHQANLKCIATLHQLGVTVGYSDHTIGTDAAVAAVALGARIVEKHFTLTKQLSSFRDHALSADPEEFTAMVRRIRDVTVMLGDGIKQPQPCELSQQTFMRRSIAAAYSLQKGQPITLHDLTWVRPQRGLKAGQEHLVVGKKLIRDVDAGTVLVPELIG